jgi:hypothetical protein
MGYYDLGDRSVEGDRPEFRPNCKRAMRAQTAGLRRGINLYIGNRRSRFHAAQ